MSLHETERHCLLLLKPRGSLPEASSSSVHRAASSAEASVANSSLGQSAHPELCSFSSIPSNLTEAGQPTPGLFQTVQCRKRGTNRIPLHLEEKPTNKQQTGTWEVFTTNRLGGGTPTLPLCALMHPPEPKESLLSYTNPTQNGHILQVPRGWPWNYMKPSQEGWFSLVPFPPPAKESLPSYTKIAKKGSVPAGPQGLGLELHKTKPKRLVLTVPSPPPTPSSKGAASKLHKNSQKWSVPAGPQGFRSE